MAKKKTQRHTTATASDENTTTAKRHTTTPRATTKGKTTTPERHTTASSPDDHTTTPAGTVKKKRHTTREDLYLTKDHVRRLVETCSRTPTGIRDRAMIRAAYSGALRVSELLRLHKADVDLEKKRVRVRDGKGGKTAYASLSSSAVEAIEQWLLVRDKHGIRSRILFCTFRKGSVGTSTGDTTTTKRGGELTTSAFRKMLALRAKKAGIEGRVHPHALRHGHAVDLAEGGTPPHIIQASLRHSNLATTAVYLSRLGVDTITQQVGEAVSELLEDDE